MGWVFSSLLEKPVQSADFPVPAAELYVDGVEEIQWNEVAFDRLVLVKGYKDIIRAFVEEQLKRDSSGFDDIISGKGQGLIMLLSGEPGVGKTLTAESGEFWISAGQFGSRH
jgi:SpoVK/Ycf46/Vps4 family AAA+-type ATPase